MSLYQQIAHYSFLGANATHKRENHNWLLTIGAENGHIVTNAILRASCGLVAGMHLYGLAKIAACSDDLAVC